MREVLADREAEIRIMKREREEALHYKMDMTLENKRLKVIHDNLNVYSLKMNSFKKIKTLREFQKLMNKAPKIQFNCSNQANQVSKVLLPQEKE